MSPPPPASTEVLKQVGIDQNLGRQIPLDLSFRDEAGATVQLRDYFNDKPVVIALVYYRCPMLCTMTLNGMLAAFKPLKYTVGQEFQVITVSFDPHETPDAAAAKKKSYMAAYNRAGAESGWRFLTGDETSIKTLADALGYRYYYDPRTNQYAHASAIMLATPDGRLSRYFYGLEYSARDLQFAVIDASNQKVGSPVDKLLLLCYEYDPRTGRYGLTIMRSLQIGGTLTFLLLATYITRSILRERRTAGHSSALSSLNPEPRTLNPSVEP
jgi:protein SCO1/2